TDIPEWMREVDYPIEEWDSQTTLEKVGEVFLDPFKSALDIATNPIGGTIRTAQKIGKKLNPANWF
ncbi:MAG: hypothetical protein R3257_07045, partial [bacterium]|nr:hypothetical protein [bacterium]